MVSKNTVLLEFWIIDLLNTYHTFHLYLIAWNVLFIISTISSNFFNTLLE